MSSLDPRTYHDIAGSLNVLAADIAGVAADHGFESPTNLEDADQIRLAFEKLCLIHSEVSEAVEVVKQKGLEQDQRLNLFQEELADIIIRVMHMAASLSLDIGTVVIAKHHINIHRPRMHGKRA